MIYKLAWLSYFGFASALHRIYLLGGFLLPLFGIEMRFVPAGKERSEQAYSDLCSPVFYTILIVSLPSFFAEAVRFFAGQDFTPAESNNRCE